MHNITDELGKALDNTNANIDKLLKVETTKEYMTYLNTPKSQSYFIRPCGTVEFIMEK